MVEGSYQMPNTDWQEFLHLMYDYENGVESAQREIQKMLEIGPEEAVFEKINLAREQIYRNDAMRGVPVAMYRYALAIQFTRPQEAFQLLVQLANQGDTEAMKSIALGYTEYGGFGENPEQELQWYLRAANAGDAEAQASAGLWYACQGNNDQEYRWYKASAEQKYPKGLIGLANWYSKNWVHCEGVLKEEYKQKAIALYWEALNHVTRINEAEDIYFSLGLCYESLPQYRNAFECFYKSFLLGNDYAAVTYLKLQLKCNTVIPLQQLKDWKIELWDNCRR